MSVIIDFYVRKVKEGYPIDEVANKWKAAVIAAIEEEENANS